MEACAFDVVRINLVQVSMYQLFTCDFSILQQSLQLSSRKAQEIKSYCVHMTAGEHLGLIVQGLTFKLCCLNDNKNLSDASAKVKAAIRNRGVTQPQTNVRTVQQNYF